MILSILQFLPSDLHPKFEAHFSQPGPQSIKAALKGIYDNLKGELIRSWDSKFPPPIYYNYYTSLTPQKFLKMSRFMAGRISQMRAHKSYLNAHPSWSHNNPPLCPRCEESDEDFEHVILHCNALASSRALYIPNIDSLDKESPLWESESLLAALAEYIKSNKINFPPSWGVKYVISSSGTSDCLTDISLLSSSYQN
jgi:hypothetical protein